MSFSGMVSSTTYRSSLRLLTALLVGSVLAQIAAASSAKSKEEALGAPVWLEGLMASSGVAKERARRFSNFPSGAAVEVKTTVTVPLDGIGTASDLELVTVLDFDLPSGGSTGRSYQKRKGERLSIYSRMEEFLSNLGYNGNACTLRTLCEIAESPFDHGLYGEIVNLVLAASVAPEDNSIYDEYMTAEYYGKNYGNCGAIYTSCPNSVLDIVSNAF